MRCSTCDTNFEHGSPAHIGRLINEIASLGAELVVLDERRERTSKQRPSKRFKTQAVIDAEVAVIDETIVRKRNELIELRAVYGELEPVVFAPHGQRHPPSR